MTDDDTLTGAELDTLIALLDSAAVRLADAPAALALRAKLESQRTRAADTLDGAAHGLTAAGLR